MQFHFRSLLAASALLLIQSSFATSIFINEFHYDNAGTDVDEGVEIAAPAGTDLNGYQISLYNGTNGSVYEAIVLDGVIMNQSDGFGTLFFSISGLQNGPDGIALSNAFGEVLQFISYEGSFTATDGAAIGMSSIDIGVFEASDTVSGLSLQLEGSGNVAELFDWTVAESTYGAVNANQLFVATVPVPGALLLMMSAFSAFFITKKPRVA